MGSEASQDRKEKLFEYQAAQEMLRHYDSINWQIGSILIAATLVLTGLTFQKDVIVIIRGCDIASWIIVISVPILSLSVFAIWVLWFRRHRDLYNFRNETLHRLELELGFYHYLRVIETALGPDKLRGKTKDGRTIDEILREAREKAGHGTNQFEPFFRPLRLSGPSGYTLARILAFGIPILQFAILISLKFA